MSENFSLQNLFDSNKSMTREQFIAKYGEISQSTNKPDSSIFKADMSESIGQVFDTLNTDGNETLDEKEITALKNLSKDDDDTIVSENDLKIMYQNISEKIQQSYGSTDPKSMYDSAMSKVGNPNESTYVQNLDTQIQMLNELISTRQTNSDNIIKDLESQIDNIIKTTLDETNKENKKLKDYNSAKKKELDDLRRTSEENSIALKNAEQTKQEKTCDIAAIQRDIQFLDSKKDSEKIKQLQSELSNAQKELDYANQDITRYKLTEKNISLDIADISAELVSAQNSAKAKITQIDANKAAKIEALQNKIAIEKNDAQKDIKKSKEQIKVLQSAQQYALERIKTQTTGNAEADYSNNGANLPCLNGVNYSSEKGQKLAEYMRKHVVGFTGYCSRHVSNGIAGAGLGNERAGSACQMDSLLRKNQNFKEIKISSAEELKSLPAGCIIVYEAGAARYNAKHGHIEVSLGNGTAASDGITRNMRFTENMSVFVPVA